MLSGVVQYPQIKGSGQDANNQVIHLHLIFLPTTHQHHYVYSRLKEIHPQDWQNRPKSSRQLQDIYGMILCFIDAVMRTIFMYLLIV